MFYGDQGILPINEGLQNIPGTFALHAYISKYICTQTVTTFNSIFHNPFGVLFTKLKFSHCVRGTGFWLLNGDGVVW